MSDENRTITSQNDTAPKPGEGPWNRSRRQGFVRGVRLLSHARERRGEGIEHVVWATGDTGKQVDGGRLSRKQQAYAVFGAQPPVKRPPTGSDLSAPGYGGYAGGVVALHDGDVYYCSCRGTAPFKPRSTGALSTRASSRTAERGIVKRRRSRRHWTITQTVSASNGRSYDR